MAKGDIQIFIQTSNDTERNCSSHGRKGPLSLESCSGSVCIRRATVGMLVGSSFWSSWGRDHSYLRTEGNMGWECRMLCLTDEASKADRDEAGVQTGDDRKWSGHGTGTHAHLLFKGGTKRLKL